MAYILASIYINRRGAREKTVVRNNPENKTIEEEGIRGVEGSRDSSVASAKDREEGFSLQLIKDLMAEQGTKWTGKNGRCEL